MATGTNPGAETLRNAAQPQADASAASRRLMSLDALRGFDMFWIIGADSLVYALHRMSANPTTNFLAYELSHSDWKGFRFYDLIFPLFVFMAGVSLVFSLTKTIAREGRAAALRRILRRSILLFALGIFYYGGLSRPWPDIRLMGVLQRIALAYFFAGLLFCFLKPRALAAACAGLLLGYWALMSLTPIRDIQLEKSHLVRVARQNGDVKAAALLDQPGNPSTNAPAWAAAQNLFYATTDRVSGKFDPGLNVANHFDFLFLPGREYDQFFDPEGLLSTIPAVATCLLGVFAGLLLQKTSISDKQKLLWLAGPGVVAVLVGWLWGPEFPVIKKIWTSSYVLVAGGYSALLLAAFYLVVDVWKFQKWCAPFVWVGMNAITIYMADDILEGFNGLASRLVGGDARMFFDYLVARGFGALVVSITGLLIAFALAQFLYRRKIFLRL